MGFLVAPGKQVRRNMNGIFPEFEQVHSCPGVRTRKHRAGCSLVPGLCVRAAISLENMVDCMVLSQRLAF